MGNSNTSQTFQKLFAEFNGDNIIKMADSGVFTKNGSMSKDYEDLFATYENMGVDYGIIIDVIKNKQKTIESAKEAITIYKKGKYRFELVGVAQGKSVKEYLSCYISLKKLGFKYIAIGGLLKKIKNSSRYVKVRDESFIEEVVKAIRKKYKNDWLFLLGSYHPKRHHLFKKYKIFGADFKGWILNYKAPNQVMTMLDKRASMIEKQMRISNKRLRYLKARLRMLRKDSNKESLKLTQQALVELRKSIADKYNNKEYSEIVSKMSQLPILSEDDLRKDRFMQIRNYLMKNVYSKVKPKRLLIVSCSQRKKELVTWAPAIEVYDGPMFRILRKSSALNNGVDLRIISAKYGIMSPNKPIRNYDLKMTSEKACSLNKDIVQSISDLLAKENYKQILVCMGKVYQGSVKGLEKKVPSSCELVIAGGRIGQQLKIVKNWLSINEISENKPQFVFH